MDTVFNNQLYQNVLNHLLEGVYVVDRHRKILYWNHMAEMISGYSASEVVGHSCMDDILVHVDRDGNHLCTGLCPLAKTILDAQPRSNTIFLHHRLGHRVEVKVRTLPFYDEKGAIVGGLEVFSEVKEVDDLQRKVEEYEKMAFLDELTQIPNRRFFVNTLKRKLVEWEHFGTKSAVFMADIDHFKKFNDTYGHDLGDQVLKMVAATLFQHLRGEDLICRWGGEEFIGVVSLSDEWLLKEVLERLRMLVENSFLKVGGEKLEVTVSIGGSIVQSGDDEESWVKRADVKMYESKENGRNRVTI